MKKQSSDTAGADMRASSLREVDLSRRLAHEIPAIRLDKDEWTMQLGHDPWDDEFRPLIEGKLWTLPRNSLPKAKA